LYCPGEGKTSLTTLSICVRIPGTDNTDRTYDNPLLIKGAGSMDIIVLGAGMAPEEGKEDRRAIRQLTKRMVVKVPFMDIKEKEVQIFFTPILDEEENTEISLNVKTRWKNRPPEAFEKAAHTIAGIFANYAKFELPHIVWVQMNFEVLDNPDMNPEPFGIEIDRKGGETE